MSHNLDTPGPYISWADMFKHKRTVWQCLSVAKILHQINTRLARRPGRVVCNSFRTYGKMPTDNASSTHHAPISRNCPSKLSARTLCTYTTVETRLMSDRKDGSCSSVCRDTANVIACLTSRLANAKLHRHDASMDTIRLDRIIPDSAALEGQWAAAVAVTSVKRRCGSARTQML